MSKLLKTNSEIAKLQSEFKTFASKKLQVKIPASNTIEVPKMQTSDSKK